MQNVISIRGARVHNLKNIDLELPRNNLIVITGVSGSGKSSLAFDTLYAEGQRRYVESLSVYARQFLERMDRPDVDQITGISPAIAIEQKNPVKTSRSTVGTATEVFDYLRLLFARVGKTICPSCHTEVRKDSVSSVFDKLARLPQNSRILISFPVSGETQGDFRLRLTEMLEKGFHRIIHQGSIQTIGELSAADIEGLRHADILVDRLIIEGDYKSRLTDSLDMAFREGNGRVRVQVLDGPVFKFSSLFECASCNQNFIEPQPRLFSFNNPFGACPECHGFGDIITIDFDRIVPDKSKSINQGAIAVWNTPTHTGTMLELRRIAPQYDIDLDLPFEKLGDEQQRILMEGADDFPGILPFFDWLETKKYKIGVRVFLSRYRAYQQCPECQGSRLRPEALFVKIADKTIADIAAMTLAQAQSWFNSLQLSAFNSEVSAVILSELRARLGYLVDVGLDYLTLDRRSQTLSGGEAQRIHLATALGSQLVGALYILDEPSIGLHPRDNAKLLTILKRLRDLGNTVLVVEHDREIIEKSDYIIDLGPRAGVKGGYLVFHGSHDQILRDSASLTGQYLRGEKAIPLPAKYRRKRNNPFLKIIGARQNNLKNIDVTLPMGCLTAITGVSGSGKSSLIHDILYTGLKKFLGEWSHRTGDFDRIDNAFLVDDVVLVDQSPIGRTPRSNPVTYIKAFDEIRKLFANTQLARVRGLKPGAFSFNVSGGRCETCEGAGVVKIEMQFLADLYLECESCKGKRYKKSVLEVTYKGRTIADVLNLTVSEALSFFSEAKKVTQTLRILEEVGLGYLYLGQAATTLSGGEAQRLKLAAHLHQKRGKHILYLFDEPTTGLHFDDISRLLDCLNQLISKGNSVIVIEHNLDVIKCADYIVDLGPEGGERGGQILACGTPFEITQCENSYTGRFLKKILTHEESIINRQTRNRQNDVD
ncbi:excinuclease ABC subunit UvrA [candidate division KSB1 bacterium]|nr:excinuclease ABC subunit UvrA [candidate division KSB1 bacterium]